MISSKSEFLKLWNAGRLGNKLRTWASVGEAEGYDGLFSIRDGRPDSNLARYLVPRDKVTENVEAMRLLGARDVYFVEMAPDHRLVLQGEYINGNLRGVGGSHVLNKYLMYSREQTQMKRVKKWLHLEGAASLALLRQHMDGNSWDDFQDLQDRYPDHTIEFGVYECFVGNLPGRNTIIWEVRGTY